MDHDAPIPWTDITPEELALCRDALAALDDASAFVLPPGYELEWLAATAPALATGAHRVEGESDVDLRARLAGRT